MCYIECKIVCIADMASATHTSMKGLAGRLALQSPQGQSIVKLRQMIDVVCTERVLCGIIQFLRYFLLSWENAVH